MSINKINDLHLHNHSLADALRNAALRVVDSGWYALGPEVEQFEKQFATYCGTAHAIGVANGTDALELALRAVGVGVGDEVLNVANAGFYTSTAILAIGATPVYVDILNSTLLMDPHAAAAAISDKTRAIVVTHLFGQLTDMAPFIALAQQHKLPLVEDCAQSHGAEHNGQRAGSFGDIAAFSFFPTKNLGALGDGGAVTTSRDELATQVRRLRQYGWSSKYTVEITGARNSRLDELQAALLSVKLPHLDTWNRKRRDIAARYAAGIRHPQLRLPTIEHRDHVAHLYVVRSADRDSLRTHLQQQGIASDIHYPILDYQQPAVAARYAGVSLPVSERCMQEILTLPCYPELTMDEVDTVADCINRWHP
jgi:aminotransferase EvaB